MSFEVTIQPLALSASPTLAQPNPVSVPTPSILLYSKLGSATGKYPSEQAIIDAIENFLQQQKLGLAESGRRAGEKATGNAVGEQRKTVNRAQARIVSNPSGACCSVQ